MTYSRREPFHELYQLRDDFNKLMVAPFSKMMKGYMEYPRVDVFETDKEIVLKAEIPGMSKENLDVKVARDSITIKGALNRDAEVNDESYILQERNYGEFVRTVPVGVHMEYDQAQASFKEGVLEIKVPKKEQERGKKLQID